jgi:hypothetical protein
LELISHSNIISTNALNTVIANAMEKSKLGEASFVKHDIFSSPALVEKVCSNDILSPICDVSYDAAPHPFKIPMEIVECAMNNCYIGDRTIHPGNHLLFIHELCELFQCAGILMNQVKVKRKLFSLSLKVGVKTERIISDRPTDRTLTELKNGFGRIVVGYGHGYG